MHLTQLYYSVSVHLW